MHVAIVDTFESFIELRRDWDDVYDADPESHYFLSWAWLSTWLKEFRKDWFILAAKQHPRASAYDAFFPLAISTAMRTGTGFYNEINMAGNKHADYTGFLCRPEFEDQAVEAFAKHVSRMNWAALHLDQIRASNKRVQQFLGHFPARDFATQTRDHLQDGVDNLVCPFVRLPRDWDDYCSRLSSNTRQKLRRSLRTLESSKELRITHANGDTVEGDVEVLLRLWQSQWGPEKRRRLNAILAFSRTMMESAAKDGSLFLPVLWKGETPVGAVACYVDRAKKSLLFFMSGRDESVSHPPPAFVLHAHIIRYAIDNGFEIYDFLRGNEPYNTRSARMTGASAISS